MSNFKQGLKKRSAHQAGFGLAEVLVSVGLLSVLGLGMATLIVNSQKGVTQVSSRLYESNLMSDLNQVFSSKELCGEILKTSPKLSYNSGATKINLKLNLPGYGEVSDGAKLNQTIVVKEFYIDSLIPPIPTNVPNSLKTAGMVWLRTEDIGNVGIQRKKKQVGLLTLYFNSTTNVIESCLGPEAVPASQTCEDLGGTWNGSKCVMPVLALYGKTCPGGHYLAGFDQAGNTNCQPLPAPQPVTTIVSAPQAPTVQMPAATPTPRVPQPTGKLVVTATCCGQNKPGYCTPTGACKVVSGIVASPSCSTLDIIRAIGGDIGDAQYWRTDSCVPELK